ncbi:MAG: tetratricopeptide repeat protein [Bacteroidaceae bacterium]|nr:tetratricopeptide repeat protein [Bacteroidaceae bacterium]
MTDEEYYRQGNEYRRQGNWQKAIECYAEAVAINPDSPAGKAREMLLNILDYRCKALYNP